MNKMLAPLLIALLPSLVFGYDYSYGSSSSLSGGALIAIIIVALIIKAAFWSCCCYYLYYRRRTVVVNQTIVRAPAGAAANQGMAPMSGQAYPGQQQYDYNNTANPPPPYYFPHKGQGMPPMAQQEDPRIGIPDNQQLVHGSRI